MPTESELDGATWEKPADARRYHIFPETEGTSLCQNWLLFRNSGDPVDPDDDEFRDGRDCKACAREAGILDDGNEQNDG